MSVDNDKLENQIRRLRFDHGEMTQQELAERVGVTRQTIIALEAGKYAPSLLLALRLAAVFGVKVEDVFQYHDGSADDVKRKANSVKRTAGKAPEELKQ